METCQWSFLCMKPVFIYDYTALKFSYIFISYFLSDYSYYLFVLNLTKILVHLFYLGIKEVSACNRLCFHQNDFKLYLLLSFPSHNHFYLLYKACSRNTICIQQFNSFLEL